jgi:S1-C subfamily serine protease
MDEMSGSGEQSASGSVAADAPWAQPWSAASQAAPVRHRVIAAAAGVTLGMVGFVSVAGVAAHAATSPVGRTVATSALIPARSWPSIPAAETAHPRAGRAADAAAAVLPGLVDIYTQVPGGIGAGTGIVLTPDGEVLTNNHVVDGAGSVVATDLGDGQTYRAFVVGTDPVHDVAVIQLIGAHDLPTAQISRTPVKVGDTVVGVGNGEGAGTPNWAAGTVTDVDRGIIATDENGAAPEHVTGMIQSTTGILPGDSGGPLVNLRGRVVGMDTAGEFSTGYTGGPARSAFSIPIAQAISIANQLEAVHADPETDTTAPTDDGGLFDLGI